MKAKEKNDIETIRRIDMKRLYEFFVFLEESKLPVTFWMDGRSSMDNYFNRNADNTN